MKSIETRWKGWRFRSRTEARWAVFLEALGISFEYEAEGVILPSGPYLPDFLLKSFPFLGTRADQRVWLEIKGEAPTEEEMTKCSELSIASASPVLLAVGAPDFAPQILLFDDNFEPKVRQLFTHLIGWLTVIGVAAEDGDVALCVGRPQRPDEHIDASEDLKGAELAAFEESWATMSGPFARALGVKGALFVNNHKLEFRLTDELKAAFDAARGARFEFGQTDKRWPS